MRKLISLLLGAALLASAVSPLENAFPKAAAADADIVVAKDGSGQYTTVQSALDAAQSGNVIYIKNGQYKEVITVDKSKRNLRIIGESNTKTILYYDNYAGKDNGSGGTYGTSGSASFYLRGSDITVENLTIENSFDESQNLDGSQAVAAYITGDRNIFKNCIFIGNQDTLYAHSGRQYYYECRIIGDVDFIFGGATAVFDQCDIVTALRSGGYITAGNHDIALEYGYLFNECELMTEGTTTNKTYLGRPWRPNAYVVYKNCYMDSHIRNEAWTSMSGNPPEGARFFEYKSTGPGANINANRRQLTDAEGALHTPENYLKGNDGWNPVISASKTYTLADTGLIKSAVVSDGLNGADWSTQLNLKNSDLIYGDRTFSFTAVPKALEGAQWIRTACDSKALTGNAVSFTAGKAISVFIGLDTRVAQIPSWMDGWTDTEAQLTASNDVSYRIYQKDFSEGAAVTLGSNGGSDGVVMYTVCVAPKDTVMLKEIEALDGTLIKSLKRFDIANYQAWSIQTNLQSGDLIYGDRTFTFTAVPKALEGVEWIRAACNSKAMAADAASFIADKDVSIFIGLDTRTAVFPSWMTGWADAEAELTASNDVHYRIYQKDFDAGETVILGSNGASDGVVMYVVLAAEQGTVSLKSDKRSDLNTDGLVDAKDAGLLKQYILNKTESLAQREWGDLNADGIVNSIDYIQLQRELQK